MKLGRLSISRGVTTTMVYLGVLGFGLYSLPRLPLNRLPDVQLPVVAIVTSYTGASPEDMETLVTRPIEAAVATVEGMETIRSTSRRGASTVMLSFTWGTDMDAAEAEVREKLDLFATDALPPDANRPLTFAFDPSLSPVMLLSVEGAGDGVRLRELAEERIRPTLGRVSGVAAAEVMGGAQHEVTVALDPASLVSLDLSPTQIVNALRAANVVLPTGVVATADQELSLMPSGSFESLDQIANVVVAERGMRPVQLREVATVTEGLGESSRVVEANGSPAVVIAIRKQSDANTVAVAGAVRDALPGIDASLPNGIRVAPLFDESDSITRSISNLGVTALQAFALTGLVLLLFLRNFRAGAIAAITVPAAILVTFVAMDALDITLNLISTAGLALAIGMLVDNGIVVLEAIHAHRDRGATVRDAAVAATREMGRPLWASTLTTIVVFLPILLVEGMAGELFRDLVLTISIALASSFVVAMTLVPVLATRWAPDAPPNRAEQWLGRGTRLLDAIPDLSGRLTAWCLRERLLTLTGAAALFVGSLLLIPALGTDFLPKDDLSQIVVEVQAAPGTSLSDMERRMVEAEAIVRRVAPEATTVVSDFGSADDFFALFGGASHRGTLRIKLPPSSERLRSQAEIENQLTAALRQLPGLESRIAALQLSGENDVEVEVYGDDLRELRAWANRVQSAVMTVEGVRDARVSTALGSPELHLRYDRDQMRALGIAPAAVTGDLATFVRGTDATYYRNGGRECAVRVVGARASRRDVATLPYLPVAIPSGDSVPLGAVATLSERLGPTDIEHQHQRRKMNVSVAVSGMDLGGIAGRIEEAVAGVGLPPTIDVQIGGTAKDLDESMWKLSIALVAALLLVYMVLASHFESVFEPFVIMFTVPLAGIGVVGALLLTGTTLQVTALVGAILLGGVVVNNGLVLVDAIKNLRAAGASLEDAAVEAVRLRVRPVLMTALTTILGMLPLSLGVGDGAETWAPMARTVIGGMTVSTGLTLVFVPTLYVVLSGLRSRDRALSTAGLADASGT